MSRTLYVNVEHQILPGPVGLVERSPVSSIIVSKYLSVFEKFTPEGPRLELLARDEIVILAGPLPIATSTSGVRNREQQAGYGIQQPPYERGFS